MPVIALLVVIFGVTHVLTQEGPEDPTGGRPGTDDAVVLERDALQDPSERSQPAPDLDDFAWSAPVVPDEQAGSWSLLPTAPVAVDLDARSAWGDGVLVVVVADHSAPQPWQTNRLMLLDRDRADWEFRDVPRSTVRIDAPVWADDRFLLLLTDIDDTTRLAAYSVADDRWSPLATVPTLDQASLIWTGEEVLAWGRHVDGPCTRPQDCPRGWRFDVAAGEVELLPPAPIAQSFVESALWTGDELLIIAGSNNSGLGARFDPVQDEWKRLPPAPRGRRTGHTAVWTGQELLIWGGIYASGHAAREGLAFDLSLGRWRTLAPSPLMARTGHAATWTGDHMLVWGGSMARILDRKRLADGAAYDAETDSWYMLPPSPLLRRDVPHAVWTGSELLLWGGFGGHAFADGAIYAPVTKTGAPNEAPP